MHEERKRGHTAGLSSRGLSARAKERGIHVAPRFRGPEATARG